jgi:hypothetical protein
MVGRIVSTKYASPKTPTATATTVAIRWEMVEMNIMRPEKNRNTEIWSGNGMNPIACDIWYF